MLHICTGVIISHYAYAFHWYIILTMSKQQTVRFIGVLLSRCRVTVHERHSSTEHRVGWIRNSTLKDEQYNFILTSVTQHTSLNKMSNKQEIQLEH